MQKRSSIIDIAKGLLILLLLYGHTPLYFRQFGVDDGFLRFIESSKILYSCFFMQSFFMITGYCTTFSIPFRVFIAKNIKTLLVPAFLLSIVGSYFSALFYGSAITFQPFLILGDWIRGNGPWFIIVLFFCKCIYWLINSLKSYMKLCAIMMLYILGLFLNIKGFVPNYLWHQHVLLMLPFIYIGNMLNFYIDIIKKYKSLIYTMLILYAIIMVIHFLYGINVPVLDANIGIAYYMVPVHFMIVTSCTYLLFIISNRLMKCRVLINIGKYW